MNQNTQPHVLNFITEWDLVRPHLSDPKVQTALKECINEYIAARKAECVRMGFATKQWEAAYDQAIGPWEYAMPDSRSENPKILDFTRATVEWNYAHGCYYWIDRAEDLTNAAIEKGEFIWNVQGDEPTEEEWKCHSEFESQFLPKENTYQWYQLRDGGGYWLAPWLKALGECAYPTLTWKAHRDDGFGLACGHDAQGGLAVILDIMCFEDTPAEFVKFLKKKHIA